MNSAGILRKEVRAMEKRYVTYILRCADGSLYTGITNDLEHRLKMHNSGKGAKYTRSRAPVELVYYEDCGDKSTALRREIAIKKLRHEEKLELINSFVLH
jgi:putative endonuclease